MLAVDALGWGGRARAGFARDDQQALATLTCSSSAFPGPASLPATTCAACAGCAPGRRRPASRRGVRLLDGRLPRLATGRRGRAARGATCVAAHWMCPARACCAPAAMRWPASPPSPCCTPWPRGGVGPPGRGSPHRPRQLLLMASPDQLFPWDAAQTAAQQLARAWPRGEGFPLRNHRGGHRCAKRRRPWLWLAQGLAAPLNVLRT